MGAPDNTDLAADLAARVVAEASGPTTSDPSAADALWDSQMTRVLAAALDPTGRDKARHLDLHVALARLDRGAEGARTWLNRHAPHGPASRLPDHEWTMLHRGLLGVLGIAVQPFLLGWTGSRLWVGHRADHTGVALSAEAAQSWATGQLKAAGSAALGWDLVDPAAAAEGVWTTTDPPGPAYLLRQVPGLEWQLVRLYAHLDGDAAASAAHSMGQWASSKVSDAVGLTPTQWRPVSPSAPTSWSTIRIEVDD